MEFSELLVCEKCFAVIADDERHEAFHAEVEHSARVAYAASNTANAAFAGAYPQGCGR